MKSSRDLWYIGTIVALIGFSAACLKSNSPRDCSGIATDAQMTGYIKGMHTTTKLFGVSK